MTSMPCLLFHNLNIIPPSFYHLKPNETKLLPPSFYDLIPVYQTLHIFMRSYPCEMKPFDFIANTDNYDYISTSLFPFGRFLISLLILGSMIIIILLSNTLELLSSLV